MTSVLVCDDHRIVREGLRELLAPMVENVTTAASGEELLARYGTERPDVVLLDLRMPGLGGVETTRRLLREHPGATVVLLTAEDDRSAVASAVGAGARGYLLKDVSPEQLRAAVATVLAGGDLIEPTLRRAYAEAMHTEAPPLTERELQVLVGMSQGKSNAQIGRELYLSEDTVKTHARRMFRKMGVSDRAQAVASGFRRGLVT